MADAYAQSNGYAYALYEGHYLQQVADGAPHDCLAFYPMYGDTIARNEGFPPYFLIDGEQIVEALDVFDVMRCTRAHDSHRKGRAIFREYVRKYEQNDFCNQNEQSYITEIVIAVKNFALYDGYNGLEQLEYLLEAAQRLGKKVKFTNESPFEESEPETYFYFKLY